MTNNQAEYSALAIGLELALEKEVTDIFIYGDSELVINHLKGVYEVRSELVKELYLYCKSLLTEFASYSLDHVKREDNTACDRLVNVILNQQDKQACYIPDEFFDLSLPAPRFIPVSAPSRT